MVDLDEDYMLGDSRETELYCMFGQGFVAGNRPQAGMGTDIDYQPLVGL